MIISESADSSSIGYWWETESKTIIFFFQNLVLRIDFVVSIMISRFTMHDTEITVTIQQKCAHLSEDA